MQFLNFIRARFRSRTTPDVFVLGNQKSGTTVIAAALAECAGVSASLDLHAIHTPRMTAAYVDRSLTVDDIVRKCGGRFCATVVKEPILTFYADELLRAFPDARFAFIVRDPRDNIRSILNRLRLPGDQPTLSEKQWAGVSVTWRETIANRRLGFAFGNYIESLAYRWLRAWQLCAGAGHERMVAVRYEDFVADKIGFTRRLTESVGLQVRVEALKTVNKQYQERGDRAVSWSRFFRKNLAVINGVCHSAMSEIGYDIDRDNAGPEGVRPWGDQRACQGA